ncbi:type IX secretion system protein PorD [Psychroflexus planctonicus]|uniref:DUF4835 domain-containing protein n=1 Tax=Psychroflexus planctonicus TaxID=1526575 RepID=A0ABQ1SGR0_9FLAO|nr:DUF4835 family protein [Psychroflexus planctonicus]GGE30565.1 DUF4835 domain-containing protein [Psychroflexus planctonicus]
MKKVVFLILSFSFLMHFSANAQEFDCQVVVDAKQTGKLQLTIFDNLEKAIQEFVNQKKWTDKQYKDHQKLKCSMFILITSYDSDNFTGSIQFQASRPVFGSDYSTPLLNVNDRNFSFRYTEFQPLNFNPNSFETNLMSVVAYYLNTSLGLDADSFEPLGGTSYYEQAQQIANAAQSANATGWGGRGSSGDFNRFNINRDLLAQNFSTFREALYVYHREGLDVMHEDIDLGKEKIIASLNMIQEVNKTRPNSALIRTFFDAKAGEIQMILKDGPKKDIASIKEALYKMAPVHNRLWKEIK